MQIPNFKDLMWWFFFTFLNDVLLHNFDHAWIILCPDYELHRLTSDLK